MIFMKQGVVNKVFVFLTLLWGLITLLSGFSFSHFNIPATLHPQWSIITVIPIIYFQYHWIRLCSKVSGDRLVRDFLMRRYVLIIWLVASTLTGAATHMGFLPFFFHQLLSWPLVFYFIWDSAVLIRSFF